jgi:hypothetical protein
MKQAVNPLMKYVGILSDQETRIMLYAIKGNKYNKNIRAKFDMMITRKNPT